MIEYELVGIDWSDDSIFDLESTTLLVKDDSEIDTQSDSEGIPTGTSLEAIKKRQDVIRAYWVQLKQKYPELSDRKILNASIKEYIYIVHRSFEEAIAHSAKTYRSTKAFLRLEEVLQKARPVARLATKLEDKNQRDYSQMLIMTCDLEEIGRIKVVVGVSRKTIVDGIAKKEEYATIALTDGQKLIERNKMNGKTKKHLKK